MDLYLYLGLLFWHIIRHLFRPDRPKASEDPRGDLKVFPDEIILTIADHLPGSSLALLGLTCRPFHQLFSRYMPTRTLVPRREQENFWQILERDIGNLYFCHECVKPHRWDTWGKRLGYAALRLSVGPCVFRWRYSCHPQPELIIPFPYAHLIINRHLYGPLHGLPVSKVEQNACTTRLENGGRLRKTVQGRIINDELFLKKSLEIWHVGGEDLQLREIISRQYFNVCKHAWIGPNSFDFYAIPEVSRPLEWFRACKDALGSCYDCLTDYSLSIAWGEAEGQQKGWLVSITSYHQLGSCRSPHDWKWSMASDESTPWHKPRCQRTGHEPGVVRQRWQKADGIDCVLGGKFLGPDARRSNWCAPGSPPCSWSSICPIDHVDT
ncbi:hypothetical protein NM208_g2181 [Fusarium decemcellulare]|uniref:Uncharacterized protein n=1 Tax=Fusarium decemcellulare TaxID=57161 RepID=A0ACC1STZ5_9HYPO|nr:hypothetical protein NM208_g2181 [Fusarium decemcellulare]